MLARHERGVHGGADVGGGFHGAHTALGLLARGVQIDAVHPRGGRLGCLAGGVDEEREAAMEPASIAFQLGSRGAEDRDVHLAELPGDVPEVHAVAVRLENLSDHARRDVRGEVADQDLRLAARGKGVAILGVAETRRGATPPLAAERLERGRGRGGWGGSTRGGRIDTRRRRRGGVANLPRPRRVASAHVRRERGDIFGTAAAARPGRELGPVLQVPSAAPAELRGGTRRTLLPLVAAKTHRSRARLRE